MMSLHSGDIVSNKHFSIFCSDTIYVTFRQISKNKNLSVQNKNNNVAFVIDVTINDDGNSFTSNFTRFLTSWVGRIDTGI